MTCRKMTSVEAPDFPTLTLTELEATASLGLTWLLTLNGTAVTSEEAMVLEVLLVFSVDLHQGACNGKAQSLALTCVTATIEVSLDVVFLSHLEQL